MMVTIDEEPTMRDEARTILEALNWRYATKVFDTTKRVSDEDLNVILEAIRLAPTSRGLQPFQVVVVTDTVTKQNIRKAAFDQAQVETASHLLVFCARPDTTERAAKLFAHARKNGVPAANIAKMEKNVRLGEIKNKLTFSQKSWATQQAYIALGYATLAAAQLRIDSCPMEGFFPSKVANILKLPKGVSPVALLAIGNRSPQDSVRTKYRLKSEELIIHN